MKRSLAGAAVRPKKLRLAGAIQVITCVIGANAVAALGQHFNQIAADAIADCIGGQILQSAVATSAQATPLAPLHQPDGMITQVPEACGAGYHMVNGTCVRTAARRNAARCAVGMRTVGGRCVK